MTLSVGSRLGPYEIQAPLGSGGMGEVYKARDTRLGRDVAVKILPPSLAGQADFRERFEREARTISQLSHPHICALYDVGKQDGTDFLVMEYLEGETLAARLVRGPLPLDQTLRLGLQIADALDKAHRHGIVHRDLKPGNVMLTKSGVKLLDFGLAKAMTGAGKPSAVTSLPTEMGSPNLTQEGTILGTFQYMAPEQLEGKEADARSDVFALGAVLYEMATGRKAFDAKSRASLIAAILEHEPAPISPAQPAVPVAFERLVRICLAKDPDERIQTAHDVALELRWIAEGSQAGVAVPVVGRRKSRERLAWIVAGLAVLAAAAGIAIARSRPAAASPRVLRTTVLLPEKLRLANAVISPDGSRIAFSGTDENGKTQIWVRPLDADAATALPGTEGGLLPFWSPDSRSIGFFADKKLKRVDVSGGSPLVVCDVDGVGGAWSPKGDILVSEPAGPVLRVAASGAKPTPVTRLDTSRGETGHRYPFFLPDGRHFLYLALNVAGNSSDPANRLWVGSLDGGPAKPLLATRFNGQYANGYLLFVRGGDSGGSLLAQPFDAARLELSGEPIIVAEQIGLYGDYLGFADYSVSAAGTLVFDSFRLITRLEWYDRGGKPAGVLGEPAAHSFPRISPDGSRVAFDVYDARSNTSQVWVADVARGVRSRVSGGSPNNWGPVWSPDGSRIAFQTDRKHQSDVYVQASSGSGGDQPLTDEAGQKIAADWSSDNRFLLCIDREAAGQRLMQIAAVPLAPPHTMMTVVPRAANDFYSARLSPDGRWLAYDLDESGRREIYVVSFPEGQGKVQISDAGGLGAHWSRGGREILYTSFDGRVLAVDVDASRGMRVGTPKALFQLPEGAGPGWDVAGDGERFIVNVPVVKSSSIPLSLVVNCTAGLKK